MKTVKITLSEIKKTIRNVVQEQTKKTKKTTTISESQLKKLISRMINEEMENMSRIDPKENLEYFLSFNNDDIYTAWMNEEITDEQAIEAMRDSESISYDPKTDYVELYSGR